MRVAQHQENKDGKLRFAKEDKNRVCMAGSLVISSRVNHHCAYKEILRRKGRGIKRKYCLDRQGTMEIDTTEMKR